MIKKNHEWQQNGLQMEAKISVQTSVWPAYAKKNKMNKCKANQLNYLPHKTGWKYHRCIGASRGRQEQNLWVSRCEQASSRSTHLRDARESSESWTHLHGGWEAWHPSTEETGLVAGDESFFPSCHSLFPNLQHPMAVCFSPSFFLLLFLSFKMKLELGRW